MTDQFLQEIKAELTNGHSKKRHPFRYFTLATSHKDSPRQRTVVLRKILPELNILFYTDARSYKVEDFKKNHNVSALFYHPKKLMQLRVEGEALIITDQKQLKQYWNNIQESSKKDYITEKVPGSPIKNPDNVDYLEEEHHFCAIKIVPKSIEYLKLKRPNHIRILFEKTEEEWNGEFLVP